MIGGGSWGELVFGLARVRYRFCGRGRLPPASAPPFQRISKLLLEALAAQRKDLLPVSVKQGRPLGVGKLANCREFLIACVDKRPDITMPEPAAVQETKRSLKARAPPFFIGKPPPGKTGATAMQGRAEVRKERTVVKEARTFWMSRRLPWRMAPHRLVFVDIPPSLSLEQPFDFNAGFAGVITETADRVGPPHRSEYPAATRWSSGLRRSARAAIATGSASA